MKGLIWIGIWFFGLGLWGQQVRVDSLRSPDMELQEDFGKQRKIWYQSKNPDNEDQLEKLTNPVIENAVDAGRVDFPPYLAWVFVILALLTVLFFLFRGKLEKVLSSKTKQVTELGEILEEDIREIPMEDALKRAWKIGAYDMVVRLLFLQYLKDLDALGHIRWSGHKTNIDFSFEISDVAIRKDFNALSMAFDAVWYGKQRVSKGQAKAFEKQSAKVHTALNQKEVPHE